MKRLLCGVLLMIALMGISSCTNEQNPFEDGNYRFQRVKDKHIMKTVRMSFGGDFITESEEPLLRAEDRDTYTAINVFRTENDKDGAEEEKYAYGLFKNKDNISIDVLTGYSYRFEATILIDREGEDKVWANEGWYAQPFKLQYSQNLSGTPQDYPNTKLNNFQYSSINDKTNEFVDDDKRLYFTQLSSGTTSVQTGTGQYGIYRHPRIKRYYGVNKSYNPETSDVVDIPMAYKRFGIKVLVEELPAGNITVSDATSYSVTEHNVKNSLLIPSTPLSCDDGSNNVWEGFYSMNDLKATSETFTLEFTWHKPGGLTDSYTTQITVKANTIKVLKLKFTGSTNYNTPGNINFIKEDEKLDEESELRKYDFDTKQESKDDDQNVNQEENQEE